MVKSKPESQQNTAAARHPGHIRGRFRKAADRLVTGYTESISYDWRLYQYDIAGSIAHVRMLGRQGIVSPEEAGSIVDGLSEIREEIERGKLAFKPELEDIHMNIESRLIDKIGDAGRRLHTARSRNDQVATDMRLFVKDAISRTIGRLRDFQTALLDLADGNRDTILPGYTHLQPAQPVLLAHHLLAYFEMLQRDVERFKDCLSRTDVLPLGSGALAGVAYPIDREFVAGELGFSRTSSNSMDGVADRDFVIEYEAAACISMMHLSRLAEEMVLWSSSEFGFIEMDESYSTGSSIMPQKKNPDVAELARGKTGRVYGHLMAFLTVMKGLPLTYNRDMQEDKEGLFDTVDTLLATLEVFAGMIKTVKVYPERMRQAVAKSYLVATDIADYLVGKGEPFRTAHGVVARLVRYAASRGRLLDGLSLAEYRRFSKRFEADVLLITAETSLAARDVAGGVAPSRVGRALSRARRTVR